MSGQATDGGIAPGPRGRAMSTPRRKRFVLPLVVVATLALLTLLFAFAREHTSLRDIPSGTGYSAWELCTRTMQSRDSFARVKADYLAPKMRQLTMIWTIDHRPGDRVRVATWLPTLAHARTAVFRRGLGCTLVPPDSSVAAVSAQPFRAAPRVPARAEPWPLGEGPVESSLLSAARAALIARHAETIFGEPAAPSPPRQNTLALLVAEHGHLVYERYAEGHDREQPLLGWSMTKTLTALIAGLLHHDGKIDLDAEVGLPRWQGTDKHAIRWRHLLNMAPGLRWFEGYGGQSDATEMLFSHADQGAWAADRPLTTRPGSSFVYSTGFSNIAMRRMRQLLGGSHQALYDYYQSRLFAPLGIRDGVIEPDASGTPVGGARGVLRPVDWLRLGRLVENGGSWNGAPLLSREYVEFMLAPSPAAAEYGGSIWRQPSTRVAAETRARLPADTVWFAGHMGQYLIVVPSRQLLVLRIGVAHDLGPTTDRVFALAADLATGS